MTPADIQLVRDFVLRALRRYPRGADADLLRTACRAVGVEIEADGPDGIHAQIQYLADQGFIAPVPQPHTPSHKVWRITAAGDDCLLERGIA